MKPFWVDWNGDQLAIGRGSDPSAQELLRYKGPLNGQFSAISLDSKSTKGSKWLIVHETGEENRKKLSCL